MVYVLIMHWLFLSLHRYLKCDLLTYNLNALGTKFDVIYIDPPLEEYTRRYCGYEFTQQMWDFEDVRTYVLVVYICTVCMHVCTYNTYYCTYSMCSPVCSTCHPGRLMNGYITNSPEHNSAVCPICHDVSPSRYI